MKPSRFDARRSSSGPIAAWWRGRTSEQRGCLLALCVLSAVACACAGLAVLVAQSDLLDTLGMPSDDQDRLGWAADSAHLAVAVSPAMRDTLQELADEFNRQGHLAPDGQTMEVVTVVLAPERMVEESLEAPSFQALAPDSSLWLNQLEQLWGIRGDEAPDAQVEDTLIPIGNRRTSAPVRFAASPVVIAAWESVARDLGWPNRAIGWQDVQRKATQDADFKWNHPSTGHASGILATLAEFYAGAGLTRGLTAEAATAERTLEYVRGVEATVRFYGESEDVIVERLASEGRAFLDAFVAQEQAVVAWNQSQPGERLVAIYPAEGTLWADHPLTLLELGGAGETPVTDNQRHTFRAFGQFLTTPETQGWLLARGYRPADLNLPLDVEGSPFAESDAIDWRQPETTLQIPSASVVEVVQNVWWYTKRPTNVYLVVDTSGSMSGSKLASAQEALQTFVNQIRGDRDRLGLLEFGSTVKLFEPLRAMDDEWRRRLNGEIERMQANGDTALLDAIDRAYDSLQQTGDTEAINAIVAMTDGRENHSDTTLVDLERKLLSSRGVPVVVFTIAFGRDADEDLLRRVADAAEGQFRRADETEIETLYEIISTYF